MPVVALELRRRIQISHQLRIKGEHDDSDGDECGPTNCFRVQPDSLYEAHLVLCPDGLDDARLVAISRLIVTGSGAEASLVFSMYIFRHLIMS